VFAFHLPVGPIVAVGADGAARQRFALRPRFDGALKVGPSGQTAEAPLKSGGYVLALAPDLLFHRRVPALPRSRAALLGMAHDLFPFSPDTTLYAATPDADGDGARCWACRSDTWDRVLADLPEPAAVIVSPPEAAALEAAMTARLTSSVADLKSRPTLLVSPAPVIAVALSAAVLLAAVAGVESWQAARQGQRVALEDTLARLQEETAPTVAQRRSLIRMGAGLTALADLAGQPGARVPALLGRVFSALPSGSRIDEVVFRGEEVMISGLGNDAERWAVPLGVPPEGIEIADRPKVDRFTFRIPLAERPASAARQSSTEGKPPK
jgi:hypothetical protein